MLTDYLMNNKKIYFYIFNIINYYIVLFYINVIYDWLLFYKFKIIYIKNIKLFVLISF